MLKKCLAVSFAFCVIFSLTSCNEYKKNENGLRYKIIRDSSGKTGELGGFMLVNFEIRNEKDSVLQSTFKTGAGPVPMEIQKPAFKGSVEEGLTLLSQGDSAAFLINSDSLFKPGNNFPPGVKKNTDLKFTVRVVKLFSKADVAKEKEKAGKERESQREEAMKQLASDTLKIIDFIKTNKIKAGKSENGVYYQVKAPGQGESLKPGDSLVVNYVGKTLDGKEFDAGKGFPVVLGVSQVIMGWHEGLSKLKDGDKATLFIPSPLGYGKQGSGSIPPDAVLVFDVEVAKKK